MTEPIIVDVRQSVGDFDVAVNSGHHVVVLDARHPPDDTVVPVLLDATSRDGVASSSPVPVRAARSATTYPVHDHAPPAPSLPLPCASLTAFSASALASLPVKAHGASSVAEAVSRLGASLVAHGWRHVAAPGVAYAWDASAAELVEPAGGWTSDAIAAAAGPANTGLEAHVSWATASLGGVEVVVDGACLTSEPGTGTQHLVIEVARWLALTRPTNRVKLAVRRSAMEPVRRMVADAGVEVVERSKGVGGDLLYRPYQMLTPREMAGVVDVGRRTVVGQLDMIGFSNFAYHPSDDLAFFARNLQRHLMRRADAVTFISDFGRQSAFVECPDLDEGRLHVVSCGADPLPQEGRPVDVTQLAHGAQFIVCLASTFWHKNRPHAIATFADLVERHSYDGHLVIAGPEPYYGRSLPDEDALLERLPDRVAVRVHRLGHVGDAEKWWLLRRADAVLYPSIVEGFGLVPFEAAAVGTPCLSFAGTAQGELLAGTDAVIEEWDVDTWSDRLAEWLASDADSKAVVDQVKAVAERYTWRSCAERTWLAFDDALARPRRWVHGEDGALLTRIAPAGRAASVTDLRFDLARGVPAVGRRIHRAFRHIQDAVRR
ncbi:MAG TPA: glycosyltransferase [Ilumatobacter sp.]|nr:glycosyltransferase [Ilumatobacter sp.]